MSRRHILLQIPFTLVLTIFPVLSLARTYKLEGVIGGRYPFVMELEEDGGLMSGRYAYKKTLESHGNFDDSWLAINPNYDNPASAWDVRDNSKKVVEHWTNVFLSNDGRLSAKMTNVKGLTYDVSAHVTATNAESPSWKAYFKEHLGECPSEFHMFMDPSIEERWVEMMGQRNFDYLCEIYQSQGGIEYRGGMFWSSAFVSHQCCDPAVVWAYNTYNDNFYIWIRLNDEEYWWSEAGHVPYEFRELVGNVF